ncbi:MULTISPECIES: hypothetical protein [unclassified Mesorhizobium]|uniref:hypothetical protein n=1 Tax=unclassified Mesorhizobium TaxID=325217 RepID=UPI000FCB7880|nr:MULTISPECIES: hypothetical protein [unclassified Mesorhizobium]TGP22297.1 hypothetical protein EN874_019485 [Mesorhizobium sp. M1D.F.Ca.ET.231.01.1.1]TGP24733.1 hypothetical protein EN877_30710 [Mesorhizobium sp. M1D.F.Ca.ET.234.01.1.1]TGS37336.1 hypothetical protein EN827_31015 [Mesorhizobium sp. M1D.F.Ca.ET.184.01.1.1]TGS58136.1 hypothetical protein EN826_030990 [Mesorhizobium sp. M1D.F.Ca.ET.183.01.1.1]
MADLSDTPAGMISRLDESLQKHGEDATLKRGATSVAVRASVRPIRPEQLAGDIDETFNNVILSPTQLNAAAWTFPVKKGDKFVEASGKERNVEFPKHIRVGNTLVRIELLVGG